MIDFKQLREEKEKEFNQVIEEIHAKEDELLRLQGEYRMLKTLEQQYSENVQ